MRVIDADTKVNENDILFLFNIFNVKFINRPRGTGILPEPGLPKLPGGGNRDFLSNEILAGIIFISVRDQKKVMQMHLIQMCQNLMTDS